jgi:very-short-patch-repair endonuclease
MMVRRSLPSPLAGEGAERKKREAGEGSRPLRVARKLRSRMTDAERKLWLGLRDRRFEAFKFPIGPYVADFLCFEERMVLEVDGGQHAGSKRDERRDGWFAENGFRVVRFWNNDVLSNLEGVLTVLVTELNDTPHPTSRLRSTSPSPARGEGKRAEAAGEGKKAEIAR